MQMLPCRRDLYAYETRILFLLLNKDRVDVAREIGRSLRESNVAVQGVFTTPGSHRIGSEFLRSLAANEADENDKIIEVNLESEQVVRELEKRAGERNCQEYRELMRFIPAAALCSEWPYQRSGCHTIAVAPEITLAGATSTEPAEPGPHVVECIIDQRTGQANMQWLM